MITILTSSQKRRDGDTTGEFSKILTKYKLLFHDRNASPDLPPEATPEEREAMKGYSIQTEAHKTANKAGRIV